MTRLLVATAALAGVIAGLQPAQTYEAPWCAVIEVAKVVYIGTASIARSKTATAEAIFWRAIAVSAITARTTSLDPRSKGRPGNVALARSSGATRHIVNVRYWPLADMS
jgi:hypothetical protein